MTLKERVQFLANAQRGQRFKIFATIIIAVIAIASFTTWLVAINAPQNKAIDQAVSQIETGPRQLDDSDTSAVTSQSGHRSGKATSS